MLALILVLVLVQALFCIPVMVIFCAAGLINIVYCLAVHVVGPLLTHVVLPLISPDLVLSALARLLYRVWLREACLREERAARAAEQAMQEAMEEVERVSRVAVAAAVARRHLAAATLQRCWRACVLRKNAARLAAERAHAVSRLQRWVRRERLLARIRIAARGFRAREALKAMKDAANKCESWHFWAVVCPPLLVVRATSLILEAVTRRVEGAHLEKCGPAWSGRGPTKAGRKGASSTRRKGASSAGRKGADGGA